MRIALVRGERGDSPLAVQDLDGRLPGRGAYLCRGGDPDGPAAACLSVALRRGGIPRALRAPATVDPKLVESVSR
jgi:predicted RNA-binding protein YlxR (DUF448 family)